MPALHHPPTILDIEASGFGAQSYPIEIGVVRADGVRFCRLIKPFSDWQHWDVSAEALHGISREELEQYGADPVSVCHDLNQFLGSSTAYSDGWVVDQPWLIKLYAAAGVQMSFRLSALEYLLNEHQMTHWHDVKQQLHTAVNDTRHRASADAELIQKTFLTTRKGYNNPMSTQLKG